jgi:diacylglycerol kinase (ATP)
MFASLASVLVVETLNTAVERLADVVTREYNPGIKQVKDMGSLSVLLSFIIVAVVWSAGIYMNFF